MKQLILALHQELTKTRVVQCELTVEGFTEEDYKELYLYLMEVLDPFFKGNFYNWYQEQVLRYYNYKRKTNRTYNFLCTQATTPIEEHTIRERLAVLKFFISRRVQSGYYTKHEE